MNPIIEKAHALGLVIAESEEMKRLSAAKEKFDADEALTSLISEYEIERKLLGEEFSKPEGEADEIAIANLRARLEELSREITTNTVYIEFSEAQEAVNKLMADVNSEIKFCITGERDNCTHDCSSCSGCH